VFDESRSEKRKHRSKKRAFTLAFRSFSVSLDASSRVEREESRGTCWKRNL